MSSKTARAVQALGPRVRGLPVFDPEFRQARKPRPLVHSKEKTQGEEKPPLNWRKQEIFHYRDSVHWMKKGISISPLMNEILSEFGMDYEEGSTYTSAPPVLLTEISVLIEIVQRGLLDPETEPQLFAEFLANHPIRKLAWAELKERISARSEKNCEDWL